MGEWGELELKEMNESAKRMRSKASNRLRTFSRAGRREKVLSEGGRLPFRCLDILMQVEKRNGDFGRTSTSL